MSPSPPAPVTITEMLGRDDQRCAHVRLAGFNQDQPFSLARTAGRNVAFWISVSSTAPHPGSWEVQGDTVVVVIPQDSLSMKLLPIGHSDSVSARVTVGQRATLDRRGTVDWCAVFTDDVIK